MLFNGCRFYFSVIFNLNGMVGRGFVFVDLNVIFFVVIKCVEILCDGVVV